MPGIFGTRRIHLLFSEAPSEQLERHSVANTGTWEGGEFCVSVCWSLALP